MAVSYVPRETVPHRAVIQQNYKLRAVVGLNRVLLLGYIDFQHLLPQSAKLSRGLFYFFSLFSHSVYSNKLIQRFIFLP